MFDHFKLNYAVKRVDVGGKVLTNYLKELVRHVCRQPTPCLPPANAMFAANHVRNI